MTSTTEHPQYGHRRHAAFALGVLATIAGALALAAYFSPTGATKLDALRTEPPDPGPATDSRASEPTNLETVPDEPEQRTVILLNRPDPGDGPCFLAGRVICAERPIAACRVYAHPTAGTGVFISREHVVSVHHRPEDAHVLAQCATDDTGHFSLRVPEVWSTQRLDIVAFKPGYARGGLAGVEVREKAAGGAGVLIELDKGWSIRGLVTFPNGDPASDVRVLASTDSLARGRALRNRAIIRQDRSCLPGLRSAFHAAETQTNARGEFTVPGLMRGTYVLNVLAPDLVMEAHPVVTAGDTGIRIVVRQGVRVSLSVLDAATRKRVSHFSAVCELNRSDGESHPLVLGGNDGKLEFLIGTEDVGLESLQYQLSANGYVEAKGNLPFPENRGIDGVLLMDRVKSYSVPIEVVNSLGATVEEFGAELVGPDGRSRIEAETRQVDGRTMALIPAGRWELRVRHSSAFPLANPRSLEVNVPEEGWPVDAAPLRFVLNTHSSVRIERRDTATRIRSVLFESKTGTVNIGGPSSSSANLEWFAFPKGRWSVRVTTTQGAVWKRTFVHSGGTTVLAIDP